MANTTLRVGIVGAGGNTRLKHIPGLLAEPGVEILAVCNRRAESTEAIAEQFGIPRKYGTWEQLLDDSDLDAIVIGTWPYLHCPITLAALQRGLHVLTEARLCMNADEAQAMFEAAQAHSHLVTQVVPSPFGLKGQAVMADLLSSGFLGELREVQVTAVNSTLSEPSTALSWRQDATLSGYNMLTVGIIQETLMRWAPPPVHVQAQAHAFIPTRIDPTSGVRRPVGTPDSVQILAQLEGGARASYHFSGVAPFGESASITLYGSEGVLHYDLIEDRISGASRKTTPGPLQMRSLPEIPIPREKEGRWQVEHDFVQAIRHGTPIEFTTFARGVAYMQFTEAVVLSAEEGVVVNLPFES